MSTDQQGVVVFDEDGDDAQQAHDDREERLLRQGGGGGGRHALAVLEGRREQLDHQRTHLLLQHEAELGVLRHRHIYTHTHT